jgi:hypothetical protein
MTITTVMHASLRRSVILCLVVHALLHARVPRRSRGHIRHREGDAAQAITRARTVFRRSAIGTILRSPPFPDPPDPCIAAADSPAIFSSPRRHRSSRRGTLDRPSGRRSSACPKRNSLPSRDIACRISASFRAAATSGRVCPRWRWSLIPRPSTCASPSMRALAAS